MNAPAGRGEPVAPRLPAARQRGRRGSGAACGAGQTAQPAACRAAHVPRKILFRYQSRRQPLGSLEAWHADMPVGGHNLAHLFSAALAADRQALKTDACVRAACRCRAPRHRPVHSSQPDQLRARSRQRLRCSASCLACRLCRFSSTAWRQARQPRRSSSFWLQKAARMVATRSCLHSWAAWRQCSTRRRSQCSRAAACRQGSVKSSSVVP